MKLSQCKHGVIIKTSLGLVGMVVGITENSVLEPIPLIQWQVGDVSPCHHSDIELYED